MSFPDLQFTDSESLRDLGQFLARARSINDDGVLLQTAGAALAVYVPLLEVGELGLPLSGNYDDAAPDRDQPADALLILGMRVSRLAAQYAGNVGVFNIGDVTDRTAHLADTSISTSESLLIPAPPAERPAKWSRLVPPRSGWELQAEISAEEMENYAASAIAAVAEALPENPGGAVVLTVRSRIWASLMESNGLPLGTAVALKTLGFLTPGEAVRRTAVGRWNRLSTRKGHVLVYQR